MGHAQSKECANETGTEDSAVQDAEREINMLQKIADEKGLTEMAKYIDEKIHRWRKEEVKFAITGRAATGKSTFINAIRNLKSGDVDFAKTGSGDTTTRPMLYKHPKNDQITFYDMPGYSTTTFRKEEYIEKMKMSDYHLVFIFFNNVLGEDEEWLVGELHKLGKPFCLVRSKIDIDIDNAKFDNKDQPMIIPEIKEKIKMSLQSDTALKDTNGIFLISSRNRNLGEWSDLMAYMTKSIDKIKAQGLLFSLEFFTKSILERKQGMLKKRLIGVAALVACKDADNAINLEVLGNEVCLYLNVFGVEQALVNDFTDFDHSLLKCESLYKSTLNMEQFVKTQMETYAPSGLPKPLVNLRMTIVGSVISFVASFGVTYGFLQSILQDITDDAVLIYGHINKTNADCNH